MWIVILHPPARETRRGGFMQTTLVYLYINIRYIAKFRQCTHWLTEVVLVPLIWTNPYCNNGVMRGFRILNDDEVMIYMVVMRMKFDSIDMF
jgi:hypothetical protein